MSVHNHDEEIINNLRRQTEADKILKHQGNPVSGNTSTGQEGDGVRTSSPPSFNYAVYLIECALRDEIIAETDAVNYFLGGHAYSNKVGDVSTSEAFHESQRIAQERIPQLQAALKKLKAPTLPEFKP